MQRKYKWNHDTTNTIDWMIHSSALASLQTSTNRKTITQFVHEWFPVNGHAGRANTNNNQLCPMCRNCPETQQHFLSCQALDATWTNKLTKAISIYDTPETPDTTTQLLLWALLTCRTTNHQPPAHLSDPSHIQLLTEQHTIGWDQVMKGRWSVEWVRHFDAYHPDKGENIATKFLTTIWQTIREVWKWRCDTIHQNEATISSNLRLNLTPKVKAIYQQKVKFDTINQKVFTQSLEDTLQMTQKHIQDWLKRTGSFVKNGLQRANRRLKMINHSITR
jgi:hypothetical protein